MLYWYGAALDAALVAIVVWNVVELGFLAKRIASGTKTRQKVIIACPIHVFVNH